MSDTISIDLPENQFDFAELLINSSQDNVDFILNQHPIINPIHQPFDFINMYDDIPQGTERGVEHNPNEFTEYDSNMDYVDNGVDLNAEDIYPSVFDLPNLSHSTALSEASARSPSSGNNNNINNVHNALPALIPEETEEASINTERCADLERIGSLSPLINRARIVRRMMLEHVENTVIPWERYTTENIINTERPKCDKAIVQRNLRSPSIIFNPFQKNRTELMGKESPFLNIEDIRNRFFLSRISEQLNTEFSRKRIEKSRRADHRQRSYSSSGSGVHLRSSSDLTITPDMQSLHLGDMDLHDARYAQGTSFFDMNDDGDYDYEPNDEEGYQTRLSDEEPCRNALQEIRLFLPEGSEKIQLDDLFQLKNRSGISQLFYYTLELASKKIIYANQIEPYGPIEIQFA
ncbi:hypothetical protein INT48_003187 [Thamnidium elegans]|uniref:Rad21/Rec8-like protein C-terminal eukaryotic domain-containing protein n=1 Tax=Thamnidium elegans TaxID=101142 RepID=A0A8H7VT00_9FUNG|nr:hypothetical protein INT48_003187 [Thamnidium elegans]